MHTEADWRDAVRYGEQVVIDVATERIGSTSFTLWFGVRVGDQVRSTGRTVYVVVSTDGSGEPGRCRPSSGPSSNPTLTEARPDERGS